MRLLASTVSVLAVVVTPIIVWLVASAAPPRAGQPSATLVVGGALGLGLLIGATYQAIRNLLRRRQPSAGGALSTAPGRRSLGVGGAVSAGGLALILRVALPEVFGWSLALVAPMFLAGIFLPGLPDVVTRVVREARASRRHEAE